MMMRMTAVYVAILAAIFLIIDGIAWMALDAPPTNPVTFISMMIFAGINYHFGGSAVLRRIERACADLEQP